MVLAHDKADPLDEAAQLVACSPLFGSLGRADQLWLAERCESAEALAGALIFARGQKTEALYLLQRGTVSLAFDTRDGRRFAYPLDKPGAVFGEIGALDGSDRTGDAIAVTNVAALRLSRSALQEAFARCPGLAQAVILFLCGRLRGMNEKLEALALQSVKAKIARFLLAAARARGRHGSSEKIAVPLNSSPSELSLLIGEPRNQIEAGLELLERGGAFHRESGALVCDVSVLLKVADEGWQ